MANNFVFNDSLPVAPLKLAALESCRTLHLGEFSHRSVPPQRYGELKRRKQTALSRL